jgi:CheY-like chemotaxis protein
MPLRDHLKMFPSEFVTGEIRDAVLRCDSGSVKYYPQQCNQHRILCVDDEVLGTRMRAEILKERGYSVVVYHSPLAVLRCEVSTFDLAILDFQMPGLNGRELLLRMRALGARFPIVLLTGSLEALSHEDRVLFARCIDKGMPIRGLFDVIAEFLDPNQIPDYGL